ncbi:hypothetical protein CDIK_0848 [Cucumispora dikerogammari]|nr:hypothetical protein CDIK_0848 [Cucumispora dikerogammari]
MYIYKRFKVFILNPIAHSIPVILQINIPYEDLFIEKKFFNIYDIYDKDLLTLILHLNSQPNALKRRHIYAFYQIKWSLKYTKKTIKLKNLKKIDIETYEKIYTPLKILLSKIFIKKPHTSEFFNAFCLFNQMKLLKLELPLDYEKNFFSKKQLRNKMIIYLKRFRNIKTTMTYKEMQIDIRKFFPFNLYGRFYTQVFYFLLLFNNEKYENMTKLLSYLIVNSKEFNIFSNSTVDTLIDFINGEFCIFTKLNFTNFFDSEINYKNIIKNLKDLITREFNEIKIESILPHNKINFNLNLKHKSISNSKAIFELQIEIYKPSFSTLEVLNVFIFPNFSINFNKKLFTIKEKHHEILFIDVEISKLDAKLNKTIRFVEIDIALDGVKVTRQINKDFFIT